ncbi:hypothetical protein [Dapis sp. BLCC M229]|uniref:hypothetical protein n=1 Tax=Dapis sp. BLCC M229 TaxID=3400188 RepID=UPI003CEA377C
MNVEKLIKFAQQTIEQYNGISLNENQVKILIGALKGDIYANIANTIYTNETNTKKQGSSIWKLLSAPLGIKVTKTNVKEVLERSLKSQKNQQLLKSEENKQQNKSTYQDWGDAPDIPTFFGRETELNTLKEWILQDRCRLIAINRF